MVTWNDGFSDFLAKYDSFNHTPVPSLRSGQAPPQFLRFAQDRLGARELSEKQGIASATCLRLPLFSRQI